MSAEDLQAGFRDAMASLAGAVCVVTTTRPDGVPVGFAATSVTSVSLDPPLLLVCQAKSSRSHAVFASADLLAVNVLSARQQHLAVRFSTRVPDRFAGAGFERATGGALVHPDALASAVCGRVDTVDAGDHSVLLAQVRSVRAKPGEPLVYQQRRYQTLVPCD